jgi:ribosomal protein S18 acetylase RimI-like enzyme
MVLNFRDATEDDVAELIQMIANDQLGQSREDASLPINQAYTSAFQAIEADPNNRLIVLTQGDVIVGTMQLTFIPGLARLGSWRGQIEAVRVHEAYRSQKIGQKLFVWAIEECKNKGCSLVQLTTDKTRADAHRFYDRLGFEPTHEGYKLKL